MSNFNAALHDKAVIVQLNCAFSWGTITDKDITQETNSNKGACTGAMRVRKTLLPQAAGVHVELVRQTLAQFYAYHTSKTYSTPAKGQRLMPTAFFMDYEEKFAEAMHAGTSALDALKDAYPQSVEQAKALLGSSFNAGDYPAVDEIDRYFVFRKQILPVPSGDHILKALGASVAADVDTYVGHIMTSAAADAKDRLREAVARVQVQCANPKGRIHDSLTGAIDELLESLPTIAGLTADAELQKWVDVVRQGLGGVDAKGLRESAMIRANAASAANEIMRKMGG